jgi:hypothetical protein
MNANEITKAEKAIRFEVEFDTNKEKANMTRIGARQMPTFTPVFPC